MDNYEQVVSRALETNSFQSTATAAGYINPTFWARKVEDYAKANLVVAPLGVVYNELAGGVGASLNVTFASAISAATLTESTAMTPQAISYTQRTFTPGEKGVAIAITRKERIRSFMDVMEEKAKDMGYALAKHKDSLILAVLQSSAGNTVTANSIAVASLASSDTLDTLDIANAVTEIRKDDFNPKYIIIHPKQENALIKDSQFIDASVYGGREVIMNGEIGRYLGMRVLVTTLIPANATNTNCRDSFLLDDRAFGIANKMPVTFDNFYKILEREFILTAVEDYDVQILDTNRTCKLTAYGL